LQTKLMRTKKNSRKPSIHPSSLKVAMQLRTKLLNPRKKRLSLRKLLKSLRLQNKERSLKLVHCKK